MAVGLYSGVSGLAVGVGLYKGVSGLWGGSSGLINGFGGGFSPAELFTTGEPGAWYDPSDLTTLFQDSAGTTPVTAAAQQVGLALDKSQGLVLGPELVTNGDFATDTDWINSDTGTGTSVISGGVLTLTFNTSTNRASRDQSFPTTAGSTYRVTCAISLEASKSRVDIGTSQGGTQNAQILGASAASFVFRATASTTWIRLTNQNTAGTIQFDNVSVKLLPGNHAFQSNSAQRPTLGREPYTGVRNLLTFTEQFDNAVWGKLSASVTPNAATAPDGTTTADKLIEAAANAGHGLQILSVYTGTSARTNSIYLKAAERKRVALGFSSASGVIANANVVVDLSTGTVISSPSLPATAAMQDVGNGWYRVSISGTSGEGDRFVLNTLLDSATAPAAYLGDGTSGILVWGGQAEFGPLTAYQRVVSSFDVTQAGVPDVWYLSFDGTDDWMLTNTITPGIDKAQVFSGVRKFGTPTGMAAELSAAADTNNGSFSLIVPRGVTAGDYGFFSRGSVLSSAVTPNNYPVPITNVLTGIGDIATDTAVLRVNGVQAASSTTDQGTGNYLAYPLYIGRRGGTTLPLNGRIYSLIVRFGANLSASTISQTEVWVGGKTGFFAPIITGVPTIGVS